MLTGFSIGVLAAFFWSLTNIIDKYLVEEYSEENNLGGIFLLSCFFPIILATFAFFYVGNSVFSLATFDQNILLLSGALMVAWIYFYLKALSEDDASVVMTLLVLAPLFSLFFGFIILAELPTGLQLIAGSLMVIGALTISYIPQHKKFKWKLLSYAVGASVVTGLMHSLFKFATIEDDVWLSLFWRSAGMVLSGVLIFLFIKSYRDAFMHFINHHLKAGLALNTTNEGLTLAGDTLFAVAILFAPIALIQTTEAYQPIFIVVMVFILGRLGFRGVKETVDRAELQRRFIGFAFVMCGTIILAVPG